MYSYVYIFGGSLTLASTPEQQQLQKRDVLSTRTRSAALPWRWETIELEVTSPLEGSLPMYPKMKAYLKPEIHLPNQHFLVSMLNFGVVIIVLVWYKYCQHGNLQSSIQKRKYAFKFERLAFRCCKLRVSEMLNGMRRKLMILELYGFHISQSRSNFDQEVPT